MTITTKPLPRTRLLCAVLGCSVVACQPSSSEPVAPESVEGSGEAVEAADSPAGAAYEVHEWGLLRFQPGFAEAATSGVERQAVYPFGTYGEPGPGALDGAVVPGADPEGAAFHGMGAQGGKPVIYLVPLDGHDSSTQITVTAELDGGDLVETWPPATVDDTGSVATWEQVRIGEETCTGATAPGPDDDFCVTLREREQVALCETGELRDYLTSDEACLAVGEVATPVLLYNGYMPESLAPPVEVVDGSVVVGEHAIAHLWVLHDIGMAYYADLEPGTRDPEATEWLTLSDTLEAIPDPNAAQITDGHGVLAALVGDSASQMFDQALLLASIQSVMEEGGALRPSHFIDAWSPDVLSSTPPWRAFGFYASEDIDELIPLTFDPRPARVDRWLAFTVEIDPPMFAELIGGGRGFGTINSSGTGTLPTPTQAPPSEGDEWRLQGVSEVEAVGELSGEIIRRVLRQHRREVIYCAASSSASLDASPARVTLQVEIDESGETSSATASGDAALADAMRCFERRARQWRYPEPTSGRVTFSVSMTLGR